MADLNLPEKIRALNPTSNFDRRYGPHVDIATALTATAGTREIGLTIAIIESGKPVEYWFRNGILDSNLVRKGVQVDLSVQSQYDEDLEIGDPGIGKFKFDNENPSEAGILCISNSDYAGGVIRYYLNMAVAGARIRMVSLDRSKVWIFGVLSVNSSISHTEIGIATYAIGSDFSLNDVASIELISSNSIEPSLTSDTVISWTDTKSEADIMAEVNALPSNLGGHKLQIVISDAVGNLDIDSNLVFRGKYNGTITIQAETLRTNSGTGQNAEVVFFGNAQIQFIGCSVDIEIKSIKISLEANNQAKPIIVEGSCNVVSMFNYFDANYANEDVSIFTVTSGVKVVSNGDVFNGNASFVSSLVLVKSAEGRGAEVVVAQAVYGTRKFSSPINGYGTIAFLGTVNAFDLPVANGGVDISSSSGLSLVADTVILWTDAKTATQVLAELNALPKNWGGYQVEIRIDDILVLSNIEMLLRGFYNGVLKITTITGIAVAGVNQNGGINFTNLTQWKLLNCGITLDISCLALGLVADQQTILFNIDGPTNVVSKFNYFNAESATEASWIFFLAGGAKLTSTDDVFSGNATANTYLAQLARGADEGRGASVVVFNSSSSTTQFTYCADGFGTASFGSTNTAFLNKVTGGAIENSNSSANASLSAIINATLNVNDFGVDVSCETLRGGTLYVRMYDIGSPPSSLSDLLSGTGAIASASEATNGFELEDFSVSGQGVSPETNYKLYLYLQSGLNTYEILEYDITTDAEPLPPLNAPVIALASVGDGVANFTITDNNTSPNEASRLIQYKLSTDSVYTNGATVAADATTGQQTGLTNDLLYDFRIVDIANPANAQDSIPSNVVQGTPEIATQVNMLANASFDDASLWTADAGWDIANGIASFDGITSGGLRQTQANLNGSGIEANTNYHMILPLSNAGGNASLSIRDYDLVVQHAVAILPNGSNELDFETGADIGASGGLAIRASGSESSFDMDNVELYKWLLDSELAVNGGFDADTDWVTDAVCTISGGLMNYSYVSSGGFGQAGINIEANEKYTLALDLDVPLGGDAGFSLQSSDGGIDYVVATAYAPGVGVEIVFTAPANIGVGGLRIRFSSTLTANPATIDNLSIKKWTL